LIRFTSRPRTRAGVLALIAGALGAFAFWGPGVHGAAAATAQSGGQIVNPASEAPLTGVNSSTTPFQILLPTGAGCTGNSAQKGYEIYSYIVDNALQADPGALTYVSSGPKAPGLPVLDTGGNPSYEVINTTNTGAVPQPIPSFEFGSGYNPFGASAASGDAIYPGTFNVGISCATTTGVADNYWNIQIRFTADSKDPNGFNWQVVTNGKPTTTTLTASPTGQAPRGQGVTLTATVKDAGSTATPAGTVQFFDSIDGAAPAPLGITSVSNGVATFTAVALPIGNHKFTATFTPTDLNAFGPSTSAALSYTVTAVGATASTTSIPSGATSSGSGTTGSSGTGSTAGGTGSSGSGSAGSSGSGGSDPTSLAATGAPIRDLIAWGLAAVIGGGAVLEIARGRLDDKHRPAPPLADR
jgi:Bacterial Ig-like domain (group 3)